MPPPPLSPSQRAYLFARETFLARLQERALRLAEDGYTVEASERCHEFLVTPPKSSLPYVVNALRHTCTCCFYRRQVQGEPLTDDGTLVACKHLHGLKALIRAERLRLQAEERLCCLYRLRLHWIGTLYARCQEEQRERERQEAASQNTAASPTPLCRHCAAQGNSCHSNMKTTTKGDQRR